MTKAQQQSNIEDTAAANVTQNNNVIFWALKATCLLWLVTKAISWKLWIADRQFPLAPPFDFLDDVPSWFHWLLLLSAAGLLISLFFLPKQKSLQIALLVTELCSCLLDQNRWQPWEYLFLFILFIYLINRQQLQYILPGILFVFASVYFFSGLSKLNAGFLYNMWDGFILRRFFHLSPAFTREPWVYYSGYSLGLIESIGGIGLLFTRTRKSAVIVLVLMHFFILLLLGPLGLNYNHVVWPWNIVMIVFLRAIFIDYSSLPLSISFLTKRWNKLLVICWGICPVLGLAGWWDHYLSSKFYSGSVQQLAICIQDTSMAEPLSPFFTKKKSLDLCEGDNYINLQAWAMKEMNAMPCPEIRVYKQIREKIINQYPSANASFVLFSFPESRVVKKEPLDE